MITTVLRLSRSHSATFRRRSRGLHCTAPRPLAGPARYQKAIKRKMKTNKRWKQRQKEKREDARFFGAIEANEAANVQTTDSQQKSQEPLYTEHRSAPSSWPTTSPPQLHDTSAPPQGKTLGAMLGDLDPFEAQVGRRQQNGSTAREREERIERLLNASAPNPVLPPPHFPSLLPTDNISTKEINDTTAAAAAAEDRVYEQQMRHRARRASRFHDDVAQMLSEGRVKLGQGVDAGEIAVQKVELSADGRNATVWWDVELRAMTARERRNVDDALDRASYRLRMTIAKARRMRVAPRIEWKWGGEQIAARQDALVETMEKIRRRIVKDDPEWDPEVVDAEVEVEGKAWWTRRTAVEERTVEAAAVAAKEKHEREDRIWRREWGGEGGQQEVTGGAVKNVRRGRTGTPLGTREVEGKVEREERVKRAGLVLEDL